MGGPAKALGKPRRQCNTMTRRNQRGSDRVDGGSGLPGEGGGCNGATGRNQVWRWSGAGGGRKDRRGREVRERRTTKGSRFFEPTVPTEETQEGVQYQRAGHQGQLLHRLPEAATEQLTRRGLSDRAKRVSEMRGKGGEPNFMSGCQRREETRTPVSGGEMPQRRGRVRGLNVNP
jgi:hypothetical protein